MPHPADRLRTIKSFKDLIQYLKEELDWPLEEYDFEQLTFEYSPAELGLREEDVAKVKTVHQLRPLQYGQPWGIFFVEFENKRMPVVVLRRILSHLVVKKRASANKAQAPAWHQDDLLFISAFGEESSDQREVAFAHFHQEGDDLPTLRVLGWDGADTALKLDHVASVLHKQLCWPNHPDDLEAWREQWSGAFRHRLGHVIRTADALAERLALLARGIRDAARTLMEHESETGVLRHLHKAFQTTLIHDLSEKDFADMYAQTITYGLLTAAISRTEMSEGRYGTALIAENVTDMVPITNPFLRNLLQTFLKAGGRQGGINFDELGIQDVVELLRGDETDLPEVLRDFGNRSPGEDPVIHFYEHFLSAYDKRLKVRRGVFYTPRPVVSYIVRSVHELLQSEFGVEDGLASTITWGEMAQRHGDLKNPAGAMPDAPFVTILDPATGTATFLVEVIDVIHKTMTDKWKKERMSEAQQRAAWNEYVPIHLLPRLYGYELMMAPYAIAHMKIGLKLYETGYRFGSDERARVYLTNALEEPSPLAEQSAASMFEALGHEAQAVNRVKRNINFTVVVGNPPYSIQSGNLSETARQIVEPYKIVDGERIRERNALQFEKNLQDDYIKFIRLAEMIIEKSGLGLACYISNSSYLDSRSFRGMRQHLMSSFSQIFILDLHGSQKKGEVGDPLRMDENVFDIQQGVCISLLERRLPKGDCLVSLSDKTGDRETKNKFLSTATLKDSIWISARPKTPFYLFVIVDEDLENEYFTYRSIKEIFNYFSSGIKTHKDKFAYAMNADEMKKRIEMFLDAGVDDEYLRKEYSLSDTPLWQLSKARKALRERNNVPIINVVYRPFDTRTIVFSDDIVRYTAKGVMQHLDGKENLALLASQQQITEGFKHVFVSRIPADCQSVSNKSREATSVFPLYLYSTGRTKNSPGMFLFSEDILQHNLRKEFYSWASSRIDPEITPFEIFSYIYTILHSSSYRNRYVSFLKADFPRIPFTQNKILFNILVDFGAQLIKIHNLESSTIENNLVLEEVSFMGHGSNTVETTYPVHRGSRVYISETQYFIGVSSEVWNFVIGSYQVCHKWLKDRRGRHLSPDDILHYQKVVVALNETIRLMAEIDEAIDKHGGWPIQ